MAFPRVSGRLGNLIDLNITFYRDGVPADPFAIRRVEIYRAAVKKENRVAAFEIIDVMNPSYPNPLSRELVDGQLGKCGTVPPTAFKPGVFHLLWDVPKSGIPCPDIFFDVWSFIPTNPGGLLPESALTSPDREFTSPIGTDADLHPIPGENVNDQIEDDESLYQRCCQKFWLYDDGFFCDAGLENFRIGFEPIDEKFQQPEVRTLEVGLTPLPLFDFDYNYVAPIIPQLKATFTLMTDNCETLIAAEPMTIGLRQGTYRNNPFVLRYLFDTSKILKGSYKYQVAVQLPNGETRISPKFALMVS
jgi:hypothetical protein